MKTRMISNTRMDGLKRAVDLSNKRLASASKERRSDLEAAARKRIKLGRFSSAW